MRSARQENSKRVEQKLNKIVWIIQLSVLKTEYLCQNTRLNEKGKEKQMAREFKRSDRVAQEIQKKLR